PPERIRVRGPLALAVLLGASVAAFAAPLKVSPEKVLLDGPESTQQLLVGGSADLTHAGKDEVGDAEVAAVTVGGRLEAVGEGTTAVTIRQDGQTATVGVEVRGVKQPAPVSFEQQIMPLLTKAGCNSGGCHGKAEGQNGFKLSVFGYDPE